MVKNLGERRWVLINDAVSELRAIGDVARETGLTPRAIRYYEERGLLRPAVRVKGADRLFDSGDVERLQKIKQLREVVGFSLAEIAELLEADDIYKQLRGQWYETSDPRAREGMLRDAIALAERRLAIVEGKLAQITALRDEESARLARMRARLADAGS
ncbi:MAG TPA: MerR family transcriptional regulator [Chloroflexota bacterium]|nr:MerR family transcriptional regulator [Chloroflexota bacterium]